MKTAKTLFGTLTIAAALLVGTMAQAQNGSVYFDGSTGDGSFATTFFNGTNTTQFTLECWVKIVTYTNASWDTSRQIWTKNGFWKDASLFVQTNNTISFIWDDPTTQTYHVLYSSPGVFSTNQWHELALVFNGPSVTIYLDAVAIAQTTNEIGFINWGIDSGGANHAGNHLCTGWNGVAQSLTDFLQGNIAEFRLWNRPLSQQEVQSKMSHILNPASESGLVGYWLLNAGSGNTVADLVGTNNITLQGGTVWSMDSPPRHPSVNLIKAVKPSFDYLFLGTNYQLQVSGDLNTWTNQGSAFTATNSSMVYTQYFDVDNWNQLFFRLQVAP